MKALVITSKNILKYSQTCNNLLLHKKLQECSDHLRLIEQIEGNSTPTIKSSTSTSNLRQLVHNNIIKFITELPPEKV